MMTEEMTVARLLSGTHVPCVWDSVVSGGACFRLRGHCCSGDPVHWESVMSGDGEALESRRKVSARGERILSLLLSPPI